MLWSLRTLGLKTTTQDTGQFIAEVPEKLRASFAGSETIRFAFEPDAVQEPAEGESGTLELVNPGSTLFLTVVKLLEEKGRVIHQAPAGQPQSVNELTSQLFQHYSFEDGNIHLAGCLLEDRPFLRLTILDTQEETISNMFVAADGTVVDPELVSQLNLDELAPLHGKPPRLREEEIDQWVSNATNLSLIHHQASAARLLVATIVWCKYVIGKLSFRKDEHSVDLSFEGWAQKFKDELIKPPAYECPVTGSKSYDLTITHDGLITNVSATGTCCQTDRCVLQNELETCERTSKQALAEYLKTCSVSKRRILLADFETCKMCHQTVDPDTIHSKKCQACRSLQSVSKHDPRMARLLTQYPKLDRRRSWKISETTNYYILVATGLLQKLLLVVDEETLEVKYQASGSRLSTSWTPLSPEQAEEHLQ